ncbi:hypothetical protein SAICODRAFT_224985 [Saitoella complicata NRRL Y-17804]|nr:uncharacterized protein SAICODRAFT_224985 [Saitoella complicata NRRL Y-17804]ODQ56232.1 hypothetical protein SAICODRAFT_224985 [Saitoella complicata NRRL Y-17804]
MGGVPMRKGMKADMLNIAQVNHDRLPTLTGLSGFGVLHSLPTLHWPMSFGIDVMHLICDNPCYLLFNLWDDKLPPGPHAPAHDRLAAEEGVRPTGPLQPKGLDADPPDTYIVVPPSPATQASQATRVTQATYTHTQQRAPPPHHPRQTKKTRVKDP